MRYFTLEEAAAALRQASRSKLQEGARDHEERRAVDLARVEPRLAPASQPRERSGQLQG